MEVSKITLNKGVKDRYRITLPTSNAMKLIVKYDLEGNAYEDEIGYERAYLRDRDYEILQGNLKESKRSSNQKLKECSYEIGAKITYRKRPGTIVDHTSGGAIIEFDDTGKKEWISLEDLTKQKSSYKESKKYSSGIIEEVWREILNDDTSTYEDLEKKVKDLSETLNLSETEIWRRLDYLEVNTSNYKKPNKSIYDLMDPYEYPPELTATELHAEKEKEEIDLFGRLLKPNEKVCDNCGGRGKYYVTDDPNSYDVCMECHGSGIISKGLKESLNNHKIRRVFKTK